MWVYGLDPLNRLKILVSAVPSRPCPPFFVHLVACLTTFQESTAEITLILKSIDISQPAV